MRGHGPPRSFTPPARTLPERGRLVEQLPGVLEAGRRAGVAAHHPGELLQPFLVVEDRDVARCHDAVVALADDEVPVGERGDLRQVGDDDDLSVPGQGGQPGPDVHGRPPADPGVHLVEDEGGDVGGPADHLDGHITRDSSPPEAALATVRGGLPGPEARRISTSSTPARVHRRVRSPTESPRGRHGR